MLYSNSLLHIAHLDDACELNEQIMAEYSLLRDEDFVKFSHFFDGRHENRYLDPVRIPALRPVLAQAKIFAAGLSGRGEQALKLGFWFNDMGPGHTTTRHDHDENDELLSGVYYIHVPENSGNLMIHDRYCQTEVTPVAGMFVFFSPAVLHSVTANQSGERRLSIGMNFGPAS